MIPSALGRSARLDDEDVGAESDEGISICSRSSIGGVSIMSEAFV
jgi:hypothetical protein